MGVIRKIMRSISFGKRTGSRMQDAGGSKRSGMGGAAAVGSVRAGMHQKSEYEYRHARMADAEEFAAETAEDALDMPGTLEAEIPPVEEEDDEIVADIAEGEAEISADEEILDEVSAPEAEIEEETADVPAEISLGGRNQDAGCSGNRCAARQSDDGARAQMMEYSDKIPVLAPVTGGIGSSPETDLLYDPGDGSVKEIQEPLPGMERMGVLPYSPGMEDPSANVADMDPAPEPEPEPEPETPDTPDSPDSPGE